MAKRNSRNNNKMVKHRKIEPSTQTMMFQTPGTSPTSGETFFIDLSQCASLANRRFYRQGLNWAVSKIRILSGTAGSCIVTKLPSTWTMSNAWEKGYHSWTQMNEDALEESPSVRPRFLDFKIYADAKHHELGYGANLLPKTVSNTGLGFALTAPAAGEWESAKLFVPMTGPSVTDPGQVTEREIIAVGANYPGAGASGLNAVSLIEGYANSRALPDILDPNVPDDAADADGGTPENWISALTNEGTQQIDETLNTMIDENNTAPYPFENGPNPLTPGVGHPDTMYPGGANQMTGLELHTFETLTATTIGGISTIKGGLFPCGLIRIDWFPVGISANLILELDLVPGSHRGYLAEPMQDM